MAVFHDDLARHDRAARIQGVHCSDGGARAWLRCGRVASALLLFLVSTAVGAGEYAVAKAPAWVKSIAPDASLAIPHDQISDGSFHLLSDTQTRIGGGARVAYRHYSTKAINAAGVESIANISIPFDPSYQKLTLHSIDVIRAGRVLPKLRNAQVRILQREQELEYRIFDGSKTANVFLDDVRVGDTVDYAYSVSGHNAVFGDQHFGAFALQYDVPVGRSYSRLLFPPDRKVFVTARNTEISPVIQQFQGLSEYVWDRALPDPLVVESGAPDWYSPYAFVQWSEFADWAAVARWAQPLYAVPALGSSVQAEVDRIAKNEPDASKRLLAVLHFVQSEIRYLGVEVGIGSHAPSAPDVVLARRFGDCKDKALMTVAMLGALGIDARPALVHTQKRRGIQARHPGPDAFNHVIVQAQLAGKKLWLDPTRAVQKGDLAHLFQPDYDLALVVDAATTELTSMKPAVALGARRTIHTLIDATGGIDKPVSYTVTTTLDGDRAESMRNTLASQSRDDLHKHYLNYYAHYFPRIAQSAPMDVDDDAIANRLVTTEHYTIEEFAAQNASTKRLDASVEVPDIDSLLQAPASLNRQSPLALVHPVDVNSITEVRLANGWKIEPESLTVEDPAFTADRQVVVEGDRLLLTDRFVTHADHVAAADIGRYAKNLAQARSNLAYQLSVSPAKPAAAPAGVLDRFNWLIALVAVAMLFGWARLALAIYRRDPPPTGHPVDPTLRGIGGWMLLPTIGIVVTPPRLLYEMYSSVALWSTETWSALTTFGTESYHVLWAPTLLLELGANLGLLVMSVLLVVVFFQRRRCLPRCYMGFAVFSVAVQLIDYSLMALIPDAGDESAKTALTQAGQMAFAGVLWSCYFFQSTRARSTFTRTWKKAATAEAETAAAGTNAISGEAEDDGVISLPELPRLPVT